MMTTRLPTQENVYGWASLLAKATAGEWVQALESLKEAIYHGEISPINTKPDPVPVVVPKPLFGPMVEFHEPPYNPILSRPDVLRWLDQRGELPIRWAHYLAPPAPELTPKAEGSVLLILAALLARQFGFDWLEKDKKTMANELRKYLENEGVSGMSINLNMDDRTLRDHLKKAADKADDVR